MPLDNLLGKSLNEVATGEDCVEQPILTANEWPHSMRNKKQTWRKEIMQSRKSVLGYSQL
jgi:hypothetical protein